MSRLPYYKRYSRDFFEGTVGMPLELKGAYSLVLDLIYMHGGALVDDPQFIAGQMGASVRMWNKLRRQLIEMGKIYTDNGTIRNERSDREVAEVQRYQRQQSRNRSRPNQRSSADNPEIIPSKSRDNLAENKAESSKNNDLRSPPRRIAEPEPEIREDTTSVASSSPAAAPNPDRRNEPSFLEAVRDAANAPENTAWSTDPFLSPVVNRWLALGLTEQEILTVVRATSRGRHISSPSYFNGPMQDAAGRKSAPALVPTAGMSRASPSFGATAGLDRIRQRYGVG